MTLIPAFRFTSVIWCTRFALAEVEDWLRRQGKLTELPAEERAWQQIRALASDHKLPTAVAHAGELLLAGPPDQPSADSHQTELRRALAAMASQHGEQRPASLIETTQRTSITGRQS